MLEITGKKSLCNFAVIITVVVPVVTVNFNLSLVVSVHYIYCNIRIFKMHI